MHFQLIAYRWLGLIYEKRKQETKNFDLMLQVKEKSFHIPKRKPIKL